MTYFDLDDYLARIRATMSDATGNPPSRKVDKPAHYESTIDPLTYIEANNLDFLEGNIVKYVTRYKRKDGRKDLLKARDYLDKLIERES